MSRNSNPSYPCTNIPTRRFQYIIPHTFSRQQQRFRGDPTAAQQPSLYRSYHPHSFGLPHYRSYPPAYAYYHPHDPAYCRPDGSIYCRSYGLAYYRSYAPAYYLSYAPAYHLSYDRAYHIAGADCHAHGGRPLPVPYRGSYFCSQPPHFLCRGSHSDSGGSSTRGPCTVECECCTS